jgi:hypothetical protein
LIAASGCTTLPNLCRSDFTRRILRRPDLTALKNAGDYLDDVGVLAFLVG